MDLYARVNILDGRAVRLPKGDINEAISLEADPIARAKGWEGVVPTNGTLSRATARPEG